MRRSERPPHGQLQGARCRHNGRLSLQSILPHLRCVRRLPDGSYLACCPCHDDDEPSLHLSETPDGTLLWHCFAGCSQEVVGNALRRLAGVDVEPASREPLGCTLDALARAKMLEPQRLREWHVGDGRRNGHPAVYIRYLNELGEVVSTQWRVSLTGDRFRRDGSPALYGLWRLGEFSGTNLWVCEGVSDTWTLWHANMPALGLPSASCDALLPDFWGIAQRFSNIYIIPDADSEGERLLQKLAQTCPPDLVERVKVVPLPAGCKEASDLWVQVQGDTERFKERLREALANAQPLSTGATGTTGATGATGATDDALTAVSFDTLPEESAPALVDGVVYAERITLLVGEAGIGKTTLLAEMVDCLLHGERLWGRIPLQPARVLWVGYDHSPKHIKHLMNAYFGERPRPNLYFVESDWQEPLIPETFSRWRALLEQLRPDLLVCDTLYDFFATPDELKNTLARDSIHLLRQLIGGTGCGVILTHHPSKLLAHHASARAASGAHAWATKVDVVLLMHYVPREGFPPDRFVRLTCVKNREGDSWQQVFERVGRRFRPAEEGNLPASEWDVVKSYLEMHEQAGYEELLNALLQAGFRMTLKALQHRVQRWSERGLLTTRREGFPAKTVIRLARVQLATPVSPVAPVSPVCHDSGATATPVAPDTPVAPVVPVAPVGHDSGATDDSEFEALLAQWTHSDDPFALEPHEVDALRRLWRKARQHDFPQVYLPTYGYTILQGHEAWLHALWDLAGTPAIKMAHQILDAGSSLPAPTSIPFPHSATVGADSPDSGGLRA
ncbi:MAG: AAA family ATPase [Armatimonadota bacterium]